MSNSSLFHNLAIVQFKKENKKMNIKCTKKLLDMLKIKNINNQNTINQNDDIENWHCNLIDFDKIYAVLLTHDKTLFSFYLFGFEKNDFQDFEEILKHNIFK